MKIDSTHRVLRLLTLGIVVCFSSLLSTSVSFGQADDSVENIKAEQERLAERYKQLEAKLFSLHEFEKDSNPGRSKLLQKAFLQSQEKMTNVQLTRAVKLISDGKFKDAEKMQAEALTNLTEMLKLLQAEDRDQRIRDDIDRYKEYAKEVDRLLRIQKGIRGQTEAGVDQGRLGKSEESAAKRTAELAKKIGEENQAKAGNAGQGAEGDSDSDSESGDSPANEGDPEGDPKEGSNGKGDGNESAGDKGDPEGSKGESSEGAGEGQSGEGQSGEGQSGEGQSGEGQSGEGQSGEGQSGEGQSGEGQSGEGQSGEGQSGEGQSGEGQSGEGQSGEGQSGEGQSGEGSQSPQEPQETDPVQQKIEAAQKKMEEASKALKDAKRENATEKMEEAEKALAEAKKELEEILRQLREEEVDSKLKMLEERFRAMLEQQIRVNESTNKLALTPKEARTTEFEISANRLAGDQKIIATAAGRALLLLKEDGTSIAFPVTVEEMQQDMIQVANRLSAAKVNTVTQEIEADIVETLNELIEALEIIQKENEEQDQQQQDSQQQQGQPGDEPLVDRIAELKMLKSLQQRIFKRHQRYSKYLDDPDDPVGVSQEPDVVAALERLAGRQAQLTEITRQLVNEINE